MEAKLTFSEWVEDQYNRLGLSQEDFAGSASRHGSTLALVRKHATSLDHGSCAV